jgi:hypothetical protein
MSEESSQYFAAPWGWAVRMLTGTALFICAAAPVIVLTASSWMLAAITAILVWGLVLLTLFFAVRGYIITPTELRIIRLGWETTYDLSEVRSCKAEPRAMQGAIRLAGNGGLFALTGWFRNSLLGNFRAFATDPERAVVLVLKESTVVVTPSDPRRFVEAIQAAKIASSEERGGWSAQ